MFIEQKPNPFPSKISTTNNFKAKKAGTNGTLCVLIVDESGSMYPFKDDTIGGINTLIKDQAKDKDKTNLSIVKFEGTNIVTPINNIDVKELKEFTNYKPGGGTNLYDAIGETIIKINEKISKINKKERPNVFVQIITDGQENSSKKYNKEKVKSMIDKCQKKDWLFTFVGANIDSMSEGGGLGVHTSGIVQYSTSNTTGLYEATSATISRIKTARGMGMNNTEIYNSTDVMFTDEEKKGVE